MNLTAAQKKFITSICDYDCFVCCPNEKKTAEALFRKGIVQFRGGKIEPDVIGYFEAAFTDAGRKIAMEIRAKNNNR